MMGLLSDTLTNGYGLDKKKRQNEAIGGGRDTSALATKPMEAPAPQAASKPEYYEGYQAPTQDTQDMSNMTVLDIMRKYGKPVSYEEEIKEAERQKKLGMLSDILSIGSDIGTMAAGRRIFGERTSNTIEPDNRLRRLKELQKEANIRYDNALLEARLADRDDEIARNAMAARNANEYAKWQAEQDYKERELARKAAKDKGELAISKEKNNLQAAYNNGMLANNTRRTDAYVAKAARDAGKDNEKYDYLYGQDGRETMVPKDKMPGIANYALGVLQEYYDKTGDARTLSEIEVAMDMIKNDKNAAISVIQRLVRKYPFLQDKIDQTLGYSLPASRTEGKDKAYAFLRDNNLLPGEVYDGPMRPQWQTEGADSGITEYKPGVASGAGTLGDDIITYEPYVPKAQEKGKGVKEVYSPTKDTPSGNKYERAISDMKNRDRLNEEKEAREKEELKKERVMKKTDLLNRIKELENSIQPDIDVEKLITDNGLDILDAGKLRMMYHEDRRANAAKKRELERLRKEYNRRYLGK